MKIWVLLLAVLLLVVLSSPANAGYDWDNRITLNKDSMTWDYTEKYSNNGTLVFKAYIDGKFGDDEGFVSAWELMKTDVEASEFFYMFIEDDMDVKVGNSSDNIVLLSVDSDISRELIGPVNELKDIVNYYHVFYQFKEPLNESNSHIWFQGEPETNVTLNLAPEIRMMSIDGIENRSVSLDQNGTTITGKFDLNGSATMEFSLRDVPVIPQEEINVTGSLPEEATPASNGLASLFAKLFPGVTPTLFGEIKLNIFNNP